MKMGSNTFDGAGGIISKNIVDPRHMIYCGRGGAGHLLSHRESPQEPIDGWGSTTTCHVSGPCNGGRVVATNNQVRGFHGGPKVRFQDGLLEHNTGHFQIRVGDGAVRILVQNQGGSDIFGPWYTPYNRDKVLLTPEPDTACTKTASITVANKVAPIRVYELAHMCWAASKVVDDSSHVEQSMAYLTMPVHVNVLRESPEGII
jgi:hypothetical protein